MLWVTNLTVTIPDVPEWDRRELNFERDMLGLYVSGPAAAGTCALMPPPAGGICRRRTRTCATAETVTILGNAAPAFRVVSPN